MSYVLIDESGRFGDKKSRIIVFAGIVSDSLVGLDKLTVYVKQKIPLKGKRKFEKRLAEIKFSKTGDKTRESMLKEISEKDLRLFILVIDTGGRIVVDSPQNYGLIVTQLLFEIQKIHQVTHIIIDKHFTYITQINEFNECVQELLGKELFIEHLDSQQNTIVSLPDFVSGALREYHTMGNEKWKGIIEKKIDYEEVITWKDLKQKKGKSLKGSGKTSALLLP
jgi:hypothetical protein